MLVYCRTIFFVLFPLLVGCSYLRAETLPHLPLSNKNLVIAELLLEHGFTVDWVSENLPPLYTKKALAFYLEVAGFEVLADDGVFTEEDLKGFDHGMYIVFMKDGFPNLPEWAVLRNHDKEGYQLLHYPRISWRPLPRSLVVENLDTHLFVGNYLVVDGRSVKPLSGNIDLGELIYELNVVEGQRAGYKEHEMLSLGDGINYSSTFIGEAIPRIPDEQWLVFNVYNDSDEEIILYDFKGHCTCFQEVDDGLVILAPKQSTSIRARFDLEEFNRGPKFETVLSASSSLGGDKRYVFKIEQNFQSGNQVFVLNPRIHDGQKRISKQVGSSQVTHRIDFMQYGYHPYGQLDVVSISGDENRFEVRELEGLPVTVYAGFSRVKALELSYNPDELEPGQYHEKLIIEIDDEKYRWHSVDIEFQIVE